VAEAGGRAWLRLPEHEVVLTGQQQGQVDALLDKFTASPTAPPSFKDATAEVGEELMQMLLSRGDLVAVSGDVLFESGAYDDMVEGVRAHLAAEGAITVAQARDMFGTSRKYVLALLEYLDQVGVTKRVGDERVAGRV
jgi:selenocysteine-specific elongation factor